MDVRQLVPEPYEMMVDNHISCWGPKYFFLNLLTFWGLAWCNDTHG